MPIIVITSVIVKSNSREVANKVGINRKWVHNLTKGTLMIKNVRLFLNEAGVSLMLVLGSVAIVAGSSLYFMKNQQTASQLHSKNQLNSEVEGVSQVVQTILTRSANCTVTLAGKSVGDSIDSIKTTKEFDPIYDTEPDYFKPKDGVALVKVGQMIGHRIKIEKMELIKQDFIIKDVTENLEAIKVTFKGENLDTVGSKSLARYFIIRGEK